MKTCKSYERAGKELNAETASLEEKFGTLLRGVEAEAKCFAWRLTGNSEDAKELVQEAARRALVHFKGYDPLRSFENWYLTIVRNLYLDMRRGVKLFLSLDAQCGDGEDTRLADVIPEQKPGIVEQLEREEVVGAVQDAVEALKPKYRAVVQLCDIQGFSYVAAAKRLGVPVGTVRSRLCRARAVLRRNARLGRLA